MVAAGTPVPFDGNGGTASFSIEGRPSQPGDPGPHGEVGFVTPDYFAALRIPLWKGRVFRDADRKDTQPVAVIDEILARQYWPDEDPIGKHIRFDTTVPWSTIVGVVAHVKQADLAGADVKGKYYFPLYQTPQVLLPFWRARPRARRVLLQASGRLFAQWIRCSRFHRSGCYPTWSTVR